MIGLELHYVRSGTYVNIEVYIFLPDIVDTLDRECSMPICGMAHEIMYAQRPVSMTSRFQHSGTSNPHATWQERTEILETNPTGNSRPCKLSPAMPHASIEIMACRPDDAVAVAVSFVQFASPIHVAGAFR